MVNSTSTVSIIIKINIIITIFIISNIMLTLKMCCFLVPSPDILLDSESIQQLI
jgi:hypothetical protein